jgi:chromosome partitioning protein
MEKEYYDEEKVSGRELVLKKALSNIRNDYDYIIIDSPPALGPMTINALSASNSVLIPIQCEFFALEGLAQLLNTIKLVRKSINPNLMIKGFLPTMFSHQNNLSKQVLADLKQHFQSKLFKDENNKVIVIPRNVKLAESPSFGKPAILYDVKSLGSISYQQLAKAVIA